MNCGEVSQALFYLSRGSYEADIDLNNVLK